MIKFQKIHPAAKLPKYAHSPQEDVGLDLHAVEDVDLFYATPTLIKTGLKVEMPHGIEMQIRSRSGLALKEGISVLNSPATIDPGYRGEIGIVLFKHTCDPDNEPYQIKAGDRVAQAVFQQYYQAEDVQVADELNDSQRGEGGFGSTGVWAA